MSTLLTTDVMLILCAAASSALSAGSRWLGRGWSHAHPSSRSVRAPHPPRRHCKYNNCAKFHNQIKEKAPTTRVLCLLKAILVGALSVIMVDSSCTGT